MSFFATTIKKLLKPTDQPMYFGAHAKETRVVEDMKVWSNTKMDKHVKRVTHNPCPMFLGQNLWTSLDTVHTLNIQKG